MSVSRRRPRPTRTRTRGRRRFPRLVACVPSPEAEVPEGPGGAGLAVVPACPPPPLQPPASSPSASPRAATTGRDGGPPVDRSRTRLRSGVHAGASAWRARPSPSESGPRLDKEDRRGGKAVSKQVVQVDRVIIRFAGDSGDGMQLTGDRFTSETAAFGNDLSTLPDFPAEIRAPAGTLPGVSAFQLHFADHDVLTPGDAPNVLVAMNPAALQGEPRRPAARRRPHRQHRRVHDPGAGQGRLRRPTRSRTARWRRTTSTRSR